MASTRRALRENITNVDESMGVRQSGFEPQLSPVPSPKDIGRTPLRSFGRLELARLVEDPNQPREDFNTEEIDRLASSIRKTGQIQPIGVRWSERAGKWIVVTGERRYRAALVAGLKRIDCYFEDDNISKSQRLEKQLAENLFREDLKPLEEARGYKGLMELNGWNGKQVAETLGVSQSRVSRALALLELPAEVQEQIESGTLARTSAYELTKLEDTDWQRKLAEQAMVGELTQRQATDAVRQLRDKRAMTTRGKARRQTQSYRLSFSCAHGIEISVNLNRNLTYHHVEEAGKQFLEEVRLRIQGNVQI